MAAPILLCDTTGMSNDRWLECRMHGPKGDIPYTIGGSDVAAIFGVSPWTTPLELWMIKKGRMKPKPKDNADQLEMGHLLEPIAAYWYAKKSGNYVYDDKGLYQHADHPYALANFDRRYERASDGQPGILECKSCTYHKAEDWVDDAIPLYYEFQLRFYLAVADVQHGAFSCFWGNNPANDLAMPEIKRDLVKEDMIFERLDEWIEDGVRYIQSDLSGLSRSREYYIYLPGCPSSVFTEEQQYYLPSHHQNIPQGNFCIYASDGGSPLGFWGTKGGSIFSNHYQYNYGAFRSELRPDGLFGKANLLFWPEDGGAVISLDFDWNEDSQRTFVAEDEHDSGEYDVTVYVTKDLQSAIVNIQSREGVSLKDWGGTSDGRFAATYSLMKDDTDAQDESGSSSLDKSEVKIGNYVYLGSCEQDNRSDTGKEPIEWRVLALDKSGEKALLVSRYALTARCYHNGDTYPTWADSDIRSWLNGEFLQDAFTEQEQTIIQQTKLSTPSYEGIDGGSDTWDKVFLLSRGEAADYFTGSADRLVKPTAYARAMGADVAGENGCCWWWLRTPGTYSYDAGLVYAVGGIDHTGGNVKNAAIAVRPALWVELSG